MTAARLIWALFYVAAIALALIAAFSALWIWAHNTGM